MLCRRRQIPVSAITQADHDGPAKGALLLQLQSSLGKGLKGNRTEDDIPDLDDLDDDIEGLLRSLRRGDS